MSLYIYKPTECVAPKICCHVDYGHWVTMMSHCKFINLNKRTIWWSMLMKREAVPVWVQEGNGKSLQLQLSFSMNLKLL